jgi:hypothetical protein
MGFNSAFKVLIMGNADVYVYVCEKVKYSVAEYIPSKKFNLQIKRRKIQFCLFITAYKKSNCTLYMGMANRLFKKCGQGKYFPTLNVTKINV